MATRLQRRIDKTLNEWMYAINKTNAPLLTEAFKEWLCTHELQITEKDK